MDFPKYIETQDGEIVIFPSEMQHVVVAKRLQSAAVSAGAVSASRHTRGKFFGESISLSLRANAQLDWSKRQWTMALFDKRPAFGTSITILSQAGASGFLPAELVDLDGIHFLSTRAHKPEIMLSYFLP